MPPVPPLNAVRAFVAAGRRGSFKQAAEDLGVTHGAVSRQVRLLEQWLGRPALFRRLSRGVALTAAGEVLLAEFSPAIDRIAAAGRRHRAGQGAPVATILRVNALSTFSLRWLLPRLPLFHMARPDIEVQLTTSNDSIEALQDDCDVVIRGGPDTFYGYAAHLIVEERRLLICSPATLQRNLLECPVDLERHTLVHVATMPKLWNTWLATAGHPNLRPASSLTFNHFYLAIQAASDGLGVAIGPNALIGDDLAAGRLVAPFPEATLPARAYFAYVRQDGPPNLAGHAFCQWLQGVSGPPTG